MSTLIHHCKFFLIKRSSYFKYPIHHWTERCRCSRTVQVNVKWIEAKPFMTKTWFDQDGNIVKITGDKEDAYTLQRIQKGKLEELTAKLNVESEIPPMDIRV